MEMEQWNYWTGFIWANAENKDVKEFLKECWPDYSWPKYAPQAMMPELNTLGEQGWELVHMEPVVVGKNHDVGFSYGGSGGTSWTNIYFCVFKRVKQ